VNAHADFDRLPDEEQTQRLLLLAQAAGAHWEGGFTDLTLVKYRENAVFSARLANGQRVAVRIHRHGYHSDAALTSELLWMRELAASGAVEVPPVVAAADGRLTVRVEHAAVPDPRQVSVLGWLTGSPVGTSEEGTDVSDALVAKLYFDAGAVAAALHDASCAMTVPDDFIRHSWDEEGLVGDNPLWGRFWDLPSLTDAQRDLLRRARDTAVDDLENIGKRDGSYGLIHADLVPENLLAEDGRLKLIDFDDAGYGWHMFELATALYFNVEHPSYPNIVDALLTGYRSVRPLSDADVAQLPLFLFLRGTTYVGWVQSKPDTLTAATLGPMLTDRVCVMAEQYLASRTAR
jgi:Ser/Thr protein kinase RdoA (MazF antagonist)